MAQSTTREERAAPEQHHPAPAPDKPKKTIEERVEALEATMVRARVLLGEDPPKPEAS